MGWLRDLMDAREPRVTSFDTLSKTCLEDGNWPAGIQPKARSLAALFSKFDRGIEVEWLEDRAQAQVALAKVLGCPLGVLQSQLRKHLQVVDLKVQRYRLPEAPFAQLLDLTATPLPPGVPLELATPGRWGTLWWRSEPGDGGELVKRWLTARNLARVVTCQSWAEASAHIEAPGPLLIELTEPFPEGMRLPIRAGVCVRANWTGSASFEALEAGPLSAHIPALLGWIVPLLGPEGWFTPTLALTWIEEAQRAGLVDCLDSVIGLVTVFHELGFESLRGRSFNDIAVQWLERRFAESESRQTPETLWPKARTFELLTGMAVRCLVDEGRPWTEPRSLLEWSALVPEDVQRELDTRAVQASLSRAATRLTVDELSGALRRSRPEGSSALRGLLGIRSLDPVLQDCFRLTPRWIANVALSSALKRIVDSDVSSWGEALLNNTSRSRVRQLLLGQLRGGERNIPERLLKAGDESSAASVMGAETVGELVGEALLYGSEFDEAVLKGLFHLQLAALAISPLGVVSPRLLCGPNDTLAYARWQLAWWTISERVSSDPEPCPSALDPWGAETAPEAGVLDRILALLKHRTADDYAIQVYALLGRLFQNEPDAARTHAVLLPTQVNAASPWSDWLQINNVPHGIVALHALSMAEVWAEIASAAFGAWCEADFDVAGESLFAPSAAGSALLWPHLPPGVLLALIQRAHNFCGVLPWSVLGAEHYGAVLNGDWAELPACVTPVVDCMSEELVAVAARWIRNEKSDFTERLWARFPERTLEAGLAALRAGHGELGCTILAAAPATRRVAACTALLDEHGRQTVPASARPWIAECLHRYVLDRGPNWQDAYAAYLSLES